MRLMTDGCACQQGLGTGGSSDERPKTVRWLQLHRLCKASRALPARKLEASEVGVNGQRPVCVCKMDAHAARRAQARLCSLHRTSLERPMVVVASVDQELSMDDP